MTFDINSQWSLTIFSIDFTFHVLNLRNFPYHHSIRNSLFKLEKHVGKKPQRKPKLKRAEFISSVFSVSLSFHLISAFPMSYLYILLRLSLDYSIHCKTIRWRRLIIDHHNNQWSLVGQCQSTNFCLPSPTQNFSSSFPSHNHLWTLT